MSVIYISEFENFLRKKSVWQPMAKYDVLTNKESKRSSFYALLKIRSTWRFPELILGFPYNFR
jgi:hypothetical protein